MDLGLRVSHRAVTQEMSGLLNRRSFRPRPSGKINSNAGHTCSKASLRLREQAKGESDIPVYNVWMLATARAQKKKALLCGFDWKVCYVYLEPVECKTVFFSPKRCTFIKFPALWNDRGQLLLQFLAMPVYGYVFLFTELAHFFRRTNCSALKQELAGF